MNEEDPLAQLRDIALPDPIGYWPPAPGWWILFFLAIGIIIWAWILISQRRSKTAYRRQAKIEAETIWKTFQENNDARYYLDETAKLVRRCAIIAYPNRNVKHLTGARWQGFLDTTYADIKDNAFTLGLNNDFASLAFQSDSVLKKIDSEYLQSLQTLIVDWCEHHATQKTLDAHYEKTDSKVSDNKDIASTETSVNPKAEAADVAI